MKNALGVQSEGEKERKAGRDVVRKCVRSAGDARLTLGRDIEVMSGELCVMSDEAVSYAL